MSDGETGLLKAGTVLSHFVIDEMIGAGAMGQVWLGSDRRDGTRVAIKVLIAEFSKDPMFRQRFEREAHVATLLKSPYTVQTLAFGREQGHYYIVMEFVEGESVDEMLANGPLPLDEALEIATDTARALEAAATQRIVHRDLKPSNIIVSPDGAAKLVDFGIASQGATKDASAGFMGTVQYAAPEQQKGEADERTDIYALGATLFHMLAGRPPFTGRTAEEILSQHTRSPFPAALLSLQPEPVVDIVRRAMQKDPQDRFQTAHELASTLDRVRSRLHQQRTEAPPPMPDQYRTMVPQPDDGSQSGATIVVGQRPVPRTAPPELATEGTVVLGAPGRAAPPPAKAPVAEVASAATVVSGAAALGGAAAVGAAATVVSAPAVATGSAPAASVAAAPPMQPPSVPLRPRAQELPEEKGGGGRGKLLLIALVALVLVGGAVGAALALAGGGGDNGSKPASGDATPTATKEASASATASGSATASATATATGSATASTTATTSATAEATATATDTTAAAPTATATRPAGGQPTATPIPPTPVPPPPTATPTQAPVQGTYGFAGFQPTPSCGGTTQAVVTTTNASGATVSSSWGGVADFANEPQTVSPGTVAVRFPTAPLKGGTYTFAALVSGRVVASGSFSVTC